MPALSHRSPQAMPSAPFPKCLVRISLVIFLLGSAASLHAAPGTTTENFLKIGLAPRPVSMGEAYVGLADDINSISYNPAGLAILRRQEVANVFNKYVEGIQQQYQAYAYPSDNWGAVGFSVNLLEVAPFSSYSADDQHAGEVSAQDLAVSAAYAIGFHDFALGAAGKYLSSRLDTVRAQGTAWDFGALWTPHWQFRCGAAVQNVGPDVRFIEEAFPLPLTGKIGLSFLEPLMAGDARITFTMDGTFPRDRRPFPSAGVEFMPVKFASVRAGYQGNQDAEMGLSVGAGVKLINLDFDWFSRFSYSEYPKWFPDIELDYAFVSLGDLGYVHRFGILARFGKPKRAQEEGHGPAEPDRRSIYDNK
ncbi:MAG: PorV/PorQ family protein [Elusimicrobia bacterium]|nr:PorV/PorQ family protein [Elusimicrobiota bacterium]